MTDTTPTDRSADAAPASEPAPDAPPSSEPAPADPPPQPGATAEPPTPEDVAVAPPAPDDTARAPDAPPPDAVPAPAAPQATTADKHLPASDQPRVRREITAVVTSSKSDKTIIVRVDRRIRHPVYGKFIRRSTKLAAHDERNACREGDTVTVVETRPRSKTKSWTLGRIVARGA